MSFKQFLEEQALGFKKVRDQDYVSGSTTVIIFDKDDTYKLEGKTHDLESHAIKHLLDFEPTFVSSIFSTLKKLWEKEGFFILNRKTKKVVASRAVSNIKLFINTLDRIHDKKNLRGTLTKEEIKTLPYIEKIKNKYADIINKTTDNSISIDNMNKEDIESIIKTKIITYKISTKESVYFNFKDKSILIRNKDSVSTFFKLKDNYKKKLLTKYISINKDLISIIQSL